MCVCVCVCHIFFIHSSVDGHLGSLHILTIINNAAVNIQVDVSFQNRVGFFFPGNTLRSGLLDHMIVLFSFLRNLCIIFLFFFKKL